MLLVPWHAGGLFKRIMLRLQITFIPRILAAAALYTKWSLHGFYKSQPAVNQKVFVQLVTRDTKQSKELDLCE